MRRFIVIYPQNDEVRACLDALILFANPREKDSAHITIRGPITGRSRVDLTKISEAIAGARISIIGAGAFFEGKQNTVLLQCGADVLRRFWNSWRRRREKLRWMPPWAMVDTRARF